ncbi:MAG: 30S ribosomal protein S6 [Bacteroidia bacterium]
MDIQPKSFPNDYETTFILKPELSEDEYKVAAGKFVQLIKDDGGEILNIEHWGLRKLAYEIENKRHGFYTYVEFSASAGFNERLEREFRYDDQVMRYLTVKLDKHAVAYNNKRREKNFGMRKELEGAKSSEA